MFSLKSKVKNDVQGLGPWDCPGGEMECGDTCEHLCGQVCEQTCMEWCTDAISEHCGWGSCSYLCRDDCDFGSGFSAEQKF